METIEKYSGPEALAQAAADRIVALAASAIAKHGQFSIALSGGSTPRRLFKLLATPAWFTRIDWARVFVFWGDERCVPPDHPDSNFRMAREALLDHVPLPQENIYRIEGEREPALAAQRYEERLKNFFGSVEFPRFDLMLQGLGVDGHTASLFPGTTALEETTRWVVANYVPTFETWRITVTAPVINAAANVIVLVAGESKAAALHAVLHGPYQPGTYPAQLIRPHDGKCVWMVDEAAATRL